MSFLVILLNVGLLAVNKYPIDDVLSDNLENCNKAFFAFFIFELVLKLTGRGFSNFLVDRFNLFDTFVIIVSAVDVVLHHTLSKSLVLLISL